MLLKSLFLSLFITAYSLNAVYSEEDLASTRPEMKKRIEALKEVIRQSMNGKLKV